MKRTIFVLTLLPLVVVTGCVTRAVREKQTQVCNDLATLNSAIALVRRISNTSTSTVDALKQAEDRVSTAFRDFRSSETDVPEKELEEAKVADLKKTYENLDKAVKEMPDQFTIAQAKAVISDKLTATESALIQVQSSLRCP